MNDLPLDLREGEPPPLPSDGPPYEIHPLFPLPEGVRETKDIHTISFDRWDHKGHKERCPDRFPAADLTSLAQVIDTFGGGTYQFFAFDRRGNYSRWTAEKDKVFVNLPCKPLGPTAAPPAPSTPSVPSKAPASAGVDVVALLMAAQERTDRLLMALIERFYGRRADPAPPAPPSASGSTAPASSSPVQAADPVAMMISLATVIQKLRPPPSGVDEHIRALAMLTEHMREAAPASPLTTPAPPAPAPIAPPAPAVPPGMVWAEIPGHGFALMRPEQVPRLAELRLRSPSPTPRSVGSAPSPLPVTDARAPTWSWDDIALRLLRDPAEQLAFKAALERVAAESSPSPVRPAPAPVPAPVPPPAAPAAPVPAPVPVRAAPSAPAPVAAPPRPVPPPFAASFPDRAPVPTRSGPPSPVSAPAPISARATPRRIPETPPPPRTPETAPLAASAPVSTRRQADAASPRRRARSRSRYRIAGMGPDRVLSRSWPWWRAGPQTPPDAN